MKQITVKIKSVVDSATWQQWTLAIPGVKFIDQVFPDRTDDLKHMYVLHVDDSNIIDVCLQQTKSGFVEYANIVGARSTQDINKDPFDMGWYQGYDDKLPECPYADGSPEAKAWWEGYNQGANDS